MLNPALVATVTSAAAAGYDRETQQALPWPLSFIVAPMALHKGTRDALPIAISTHLHAWVSRESLIRAGFPQRARVLVEPVKEGVRFGLRHGLLRFDAGGLRAGGQRLAFDDLGDIRTITRRATFVGRWLSRAEHPSTVFALLGVAP
jgi:hypothetical protein